MALSYTYALNIKHIFKTTLQKSLSIKILMKDGIILNTRQLPYKDEKKKQPTIIHIIKIANGVLTIVKVKDSSRLSNAKSGGKKESLPLFRW